ncbi:MAG: hypothetical protein HY553_17380 [Elusimicrobia bacterium]|nr:hypothetical protein [Elusimicrobiota bacterium]
MKRSTILAAALATAPAAFGQQLQTTQAGGPLGDGAFAPFRLEDSGAVRLGVSAQTAAGAQEASDPVRYLGGPHTQAGRPDAGDEPVRRLPPPKTDIWRPAFTLTAPPKAAAPKESPIVEKAREFMAKPPYNPNNGTHDWTGWCLGFVNATLRAVRGKGDPQMSQPAAKNAYYAMAAAGRISKDMREVPPGAALLWSNCSPWGHAAIATGETSADGTPIMITTSHKGIREMSVKQFGCGMPTGWGKI